MVPLNYKYREPEICKIKWVVMDSKLNNEVYNNRGIKYDFEVEDIVQNDFDIYWIYLFIKWPVVWGYTYTNSSFENIKDRPKDWVYYEFLLSNRYDWFREYFLRDYKEIDIQSNNFLDEYIWNFPEYEYCEPQMSKTQFLFTTENYHIRWWNWDNLIILIFIIIFVLISWVIFIKKIKKN